MSGAQGGQGALAGPPQGGVGVQGTQDAGVSISRPPAGVTTPRDAVRAANADADAAANANANPRGNVIAPRQGDVNLAPREDSGIARDQRSATKQTERAARKVLRKDPAPGTGGVAN